MIRIEDSGRCRTITLDRPEKANALTADMLSAIHAAVVGADANVIVLTGTGKVFSAGADLDAARAGLATSHLWEDLSQAIAASPAMTVAALNGTLAGGAFGMALACDMRVAADHAKFFYPVMKLGFLPQPSDPKRMAALTGPSAAKRILMGGEKIAAIEALRIGLIDDICSADALADRVAQLTTDATQAAAKHVMQIKRMF